MNGRQAGRLCGAAAAALLFVTVTLLAQTATRQVPLDVTVQGLKVTLTYDLASNDPVNEVFNVSLEVRLKGNGQLVAVNPASLTGDGVGTGLKAGTQKKIVWNAGQDLETPQFDLYDYALAIVSVTGQIHVETDPDGAAVTLDGEAQPRGVTPLTIEGVRPGAHTVIVVKDGYLENRSQQVVEAGKTTEVTRPLTVAPPQPATAGPGALEPKKGGLPKWIIPVAGGGAAAALLGLKGKSSSTSGNTCTFSLSPSSYSPPQGGGGVTVTVGVSPASCSPQTWTASAVSSFVHVSTSSGTGGGSVTVTVDANTPDLGTPSRSGSATIAGVTFPVNNQSNAVTTVGTAGASVQSGSATFAAVAGVTVIAGQKLTITASGSITVPGIAGPVGPGGSNTGNAGSAGRLPGQPSHALICGINGQQINDLFFVGASLTISSASASGPLYCGMNAPTAADYTGPSGAWSLTVTVGG